MGKKMGRVLKRGFSTGKGFTSSNKPAHARLRIEALEERRTPSFVPAGNLPANDCPSWMTAGELRPQSGLIDLLVTNPCQDKISVLLGKGDGGFHAAKSYSVGDSPSDIALGDFNNDGKLDAVVSNYNNGFVSLLIGTGGRRFVPVALTVPTAYYAVAVGVGDMDGDGNADIVTSHMNSWGIPTYELNVLLGNGDFSFEARKTTGLADPADIALADFNADGKLDVAAGSFYYSGYQVSILLGSGNGFFTPHAEYAINGVMALSTGDMNNDGKVDIVAPTSTNQIAVMLGTGTGSFTIYYPSANPGSSPVQAAIADFDQDGLNDVAVSEYGTDSVGVFRNLSGGFVFEPMDRPTAGAGPIGIVTADFNRDGWADIASANELGDSVSVFLNDASDRYSRSAYVHLDPMSAATHPTEFRQLIKHPNTERRFVHNSNSAVAAITNSVPLIRAPMAMSPVFHRFVGLFCHELELLGELDM